MTERDQERGDGRDPIDEEAAWAEIVAGYGEEPKDPPGVWPASPPAEGDRLDAGDGADRVHVAEPPAEPVAEGAGAGAGTGALSGPRDYEAAEDEEEDHFIPPEPPPLPETDLSTKLAWLAVIGGPLLLIGTMLLQREMSWWIVTLGIGGFLGGFATLVSRMRDGHDDDWTDPGNGAVV